MDVPTRRYITIHPSGLRSPSFSPLTLARGAVVIAHPVAGLAAALVANLQVDAPLLAAAVVQRALVDAALPLGEHT